MPLNRKQRQVPFSDAALDLFDEMRALRCTCSTAVIREHRSHRKGEGCSGCERWWELRPLLRRALGGRIWEEFMIVARHPPDRRRTWPADSEEGRWLALEKASEGRRQARAKLASPPAAPAPQSTEDPEIEAPVPADVDP
jgi:hypothetical protein